MNRAAALSALLLAPLALASRPLPGRLRCPQAGLPGDRAGGTTVAQAVFDEDGPGPSPARLFIAGTLTSAGGVPVNQIARWDGSRWSDGGAGFPGSDIRAMKVIDNGGGGGPALYVLTPSAVFAGTARPGRPCPRRRRRPRGSTSAPSPPSPVSTGSSSPP